MLTDPDARTCTYVVGDTREVMSTLRDGCVDLILTSPPFLALRSYLPADHPHKHLEIGSEPDPATFIDMLLELTAEWRRILAPHGSIAVELGDTYSGSGGAGGDYGKDGMRAGQPTFDGSMARTRAFTYGVSNREDAGKPGTRSRLAAGEGWPLAKCKALIPELYRIALAYGINPLTGAPSPAGRWLVRNVVTWCRPNPPVGALGDKYRPATSDMVVATPSPRRWFDLDAVRRPPSANTHARVAKGRGSRVGDDAPPSAHRDGNWSTLPITNEANPAGAPPLDYWVIPPGGYKGSHYAVYPPELCRIPIDSMCPRHVCTTCGEPRRRIVGKAEYVPSATHRGGALAMTNGERVAEGVNQWVATEGANTSVVRNAPTLGWTDCGHDTWRPGITLDPFGGSGTTGLVATELGRDALLIDLDERNATLAAERLGDAFHLSTSVPLDMADCYRVDDPTLEEVPW